MTISDSTHLRLSRDENDDTLIHLDLHQLKHLDAPPVSRTVTTLASYRLAWRLGAADAFDPQWRAQADAACGEGLDGLYLYDPCGSCYILSAETCEECHIALDDFIPAQPKPAPVASVQLQSVGRVKAKPAAEFQIGEGMMWNFGSTTRVVAIVAQTARTITFELETVTSGFAQTVGQRHNRKFLKPRLVAIARLN